MCVSVYPGLDPVHRVPRAPDETLGQLLHPTAQRLGHAPRLGHHLHSLRNHHRRLALQHALDEQRDTV